MTGRLPAAGLCALAYAITMPLAAQVVQRPISDFLNAQGTGTTDAARLHACWTDPAPTQIGWGEGCFDSTCSDVKSNGNAKNKEPFRFAMLDYTGLAGKYLLTKGINIGTSVSGTVSERPLADGRALVSVDLHATNALGWEWDAANFNGTVNGTPLSFGTRVTDLIAHYPLLQPSIGNVHFRITFTNAAPGLPLPDIACTNGGAGTECPFIQNATPASPLTPACPAGFEIDSFQLDASITGPLHPLSGLGPEGTPGRLDVKEMFRPGVPAFTKTNRPGPWADGWPVESVTLQKIGH